jgi:DNA-binding response OmpR family regulator
MLVLSNFGPNTYDIVLLDVKMPDLNGFEQHNKIKKIDYKIRVCFIVPQDIDHSVERRISIVRCRMSLFFVSV